MSIEHEAQGLASLVGDSMRRHLDGDSTAMPDLVDRVTPLLWHVARGQGLDPFLAEDVVQTTWLRLVQHADGLTEPQGVLKWLVTTAKREAWAVSRRSRRATATDSEELLGRPDQAAGPDTLALVADTNARLWQHFQHLPARCQQLLRLVAYSERPDYHAVSEALGMPVGSIGPTRGRCLAKLRLSLTADPAWDGAR
ncbi:MAG: RNA polymerase sigma factor [Dermatophilaceae bacterium]